MERNQWWSERVPKVQAALEGEDTTATTEGLQEMVKSLRRNSDTHSVMGSGGQIEELERILSHVQGGRWERARERYAKLEPSLG